jgi:hypothetical protein
MQNKLAWGSSKPSMFSAKDQAMLSQIVWTNIKTSDDLLNKIPSLSDEQKARITNYLNYKVYSWNNISNNSSLEGELNPSVSDLLKKK